jgi:hypothetical protein
MQLNGSTANVAFVAQMNVSSGLILLKSNEDADVRTIPISGQHLVPVRDHVVRVWTDRSSVAPF